MALPTLQPHYPPALQDALAWLAAPPAKDLLRDLAPMRKHLAAIADIGVSPVQQVKILELFEARAALASGAVKPLLLDATLPVAKRLRVIAQGLMQVHRAISTGMLKALRSGPEKFKSRTRTASHVCAQALAHLQQEYEISQFVSATPAADFWKHAEALYRMALSRPATSDAASGKTESVDRMKALLAMAAGQPEGFAPREVAFLAAYLERHAGAVEIPASDRNNDYWLDPMHGFPPTATVRRPATSDAALHFSCAGLSRIAQRHLSLLAGGERPESLGLPHAVLSADYRDVLTRAAAHWESPRVRRTNRRRHGSRVQVCTNLGRLWCQGGQDSSLADIELAASEWMVLNESASGYAIMHVAGKLAGLVAGSAIGVRPEADKPWNICVVRWARSDNPEHLELGLELVAPKAEAVRIVRAGAEPLPALLLPPLAALKRGEALLTARGHFVPGPFALVSAASARTNVADCSASHLQMHTACIEIFEFERLRTPR
jgi:hypothetical protein